MSSHRPSTTIEAMADLRRAVIDLGATVRGHALAIRRPRWLARLIRRAVGAA